MSSVIETDRLTKRYGEARGIEDVSLSVEAGEVFGFLGPNGAGKTTTIRTLLDLMHPTSGSAKLFGLDSRRESVAIRARLGNLPGDFSYDPRLTGRELVSFLAEIRGVRGLGRATELAERFHADLERPLGELSRGGRQKIGLIQAFFHAPELLILDEPTGGLDPLMQEEFLGLLREESERGASVFLSSHELDEVQRACDSVGIIRDGRLVTVEKVVESDGTRLSPRLTGVRYPRRRLRVRAAPWSERPRGEREPDHLQGRGQPGRGRQGGGRGTPSATSRSPSRRSKRSSSPTTAGTAVNERASDGPVHEPSLRAVVREGCATTGTHR